MIDSKVRAFREKDIAAVSELHSKAFPKDPIPPSEYFREFYFRTPLRDAELTSLVYEHGSGRITGFLGVMPRRYVHRGKRVRVAVATKLMADPDAKSAMAALSLLKTFLNGSQDLSIADATNEAGRSFWQALGARTIWPYNINWRLPLRPCPPLTVRSALSGSVAGRITARLADPVLPVLDDASAGLWGLLRSRPIPAVTCKPADAFVMSRELGQLVGQRTMRPDYDEQSLDWLLRRARAKTVHGELQAVTVHDREERLLGWYVYYLKRRGTARLLQLVSHPSATGRILDSLFHHARRGKAAAVTGCLQPDIAHALSLRPKMSFHLSPFWMMAHAKDPEMLSVLHNGEALLTRLDGEWSMAFHAEEIRSAYGDTRIHGQAPAGRRPSGRTEADAGRPLPDTAEA